MTETSAADAICLESDVLAAIHRLQSRPHGLTPLEQVKLLSLLYNLKALQTHNTTSDRDDPEGEPVATPHLVAVS